MGTGGASVVMWEDPLAGRLVFAAPRARWKASQCGERRQWTLTLRAIGNASMTHAQTPARTIPTLTFAFCRTKMTSLILSGSRSLSLYVLEDWMRRTRFRIPHLACKGWRQCLERLLAASQGQGLTVPFVHHVVKKVLRRSAAFC